MSEYGFGFYSSESSARNTQKDFHSDGGQGSGDWGHQGRPGVVGGSGGGGGAENRYEDPKTGGYTSFAKVRAGMAKPHQTYPGQLQHVPKGTVMVVNGTTYTKTDGTKWEYTDSNGDTQIIGSFTLNQQEIKGQNVKMAIPKSAEAEAMKGMKASAAKTQANSANNNQPKNLGTCTDRKSAYDLLDKAMGISISSRTLNKVDEKILVASVNKVSELEAKYGLIANNQEHDLTLSGKAYQGASGYFFAANDNPKDGTQSTKDFMDGKYVISICNNLNNDANFTTSLQQYAESSGQSMKTDGSKEKMMAYTITHEYGHMLQETAYRKYAEKLGAKDKDDYNDRRIYTSNRSAYKNKVKDEIMSIVRETNPSAKTRDVCSSYGLTNSSEFFAEAFASYEGGAPNELGKAMGVWLQRNGILK